MKRFFLCLLVSITLIPRALSGERTWDGEGFNGLWTDPLNWSGDEVPTPDDDVVLDNSIVALSYKVLLPGGDSSVTIAHLRITPAAGETITLHLTRINTSLFAFRATGQQDAVVLDAGAVFINESGAGSSATPVAVTNAGYFRINDNGRYVHRTARSATENLISRLSVVPGTEQGIFEFDVPVASYIISVSGRTFGSLWLSAAKHAGMVGYRGSGGNALLIRGNMKLTDTTSLTLGLSANVDVLGTVSVSETAMINLQANEFNSSFNAAGNLHVDGVLTETGTGLPVLQLNGTSRQQLTIAGSVNNQVAVTVNNADGVELATHLQITYKLNLVKGNLFTSAGAMLAFTPGAELMRDEGLVSGPVMKLGNPDFTYPAGKGGIYAPVKISTSDLYDLNDRTIVEYKRANPQTMIGNVYDQQQGRFIHHISEVEYWEISHTGNSTSSVSIPVNTESFCRDLHQTFITSFASARWFYNNSSVVTGPVTTGGFQSGVIETGQVRLSQSGYLTTGTSLPSVQNPLPLHLLSFTASLLPPRNVGLSWTIADADKDIKNFYVERRAAFLPGSNVSDTFFKNDTDVPAVQNQTSYSIISRLPSPGIYQYRIKMMDTDGNVSYSNMRMVRTGEDVSYAMLVRLVPNPVMYQATLIVASPDDNKIECIIRNSAGLIVKIITVPIHRGTTSIPLSLKELRTGIYFVTGMTGRSITNSVCFYRG